MVDETMIIGSAEHVRSEVARWEAAGVTTLLVTCQDAAQVAALAEAVL